MATEYAALWVHFLWSGVLTMLFNMIALRQFGLATKRMASHQSLEVSHTKRRLLRVAVMISTCLLVMMGALLSTSSKLGEWSRTADISLACATKETQFSKNWDAYGFTDGDIIEACSMEDANEVNVYTDKFCQTSCFWYSTIATNGLTCQSSANNETLEEQAESGKPGFTVCDCPCSSLIQIQRPRFESAFSL
jgi:hypothetical protein